MAVRSVEAVDVTSKGFEGEDREDATQFALKWVGTHKDKAKQDSSRKTFSLGNSTEGTDATEFNFIGYDADWQNRWDSGLRWDIGFGLQYRNYPNDEDIITDELFGDTRVDNLIRFSTGIGWEFTPKINPSGSVVRNLSSNPM